MITQTWEEFDVKQKFCKECRNINVYVHVPYKPAVYSDPFNSQRKSSNNGHIEKDGLQLSDIVQGIDLDQGDHFG